MCVSVGGCTGQRPTSGRRCSPSSLLRKGSSCFYGCAVSSRLAVLETPGQFCLCLQAHQRRPGTAEVCCSRGGTWMPSSRIFHGFPLLFLWSPEVIWLYHGSGAIVPAHGKRQEKQECKFSSRWLKDSRCLWGGASIPNYRNKMFAVTREMQIKLWWCKISQLSSEKVKQNPLMLVHLKSLTYFQE